MQNAIIDAQAPLGVRRIDMLASPHQVRRALPAAIAEGMGPTDKQAAFLNVPRRT